MKNKISEQDLLKIIKNTLDDSALQLEPYATHRLQNSMGWGVRDFTPSLRVVLAWQT